MVNGLRRNEHEAFAARALTVLRAREIDVDAIALAQSLGCFRVRILTTLVYEVQRRAGPFGLATLCIGVGQGMALVVERGETTPFRPAPTFEETRSTAWPSQPSTRQPASCYRRSKR